jgi:hypothetical protein
MMSVLNDKERAVIDTITMRFHAPEALIYLKKLGMEMGIATYYRYRKKVENMKLERMQFIAQHFQELHLEKIDRLELIDRLMWENYEKEKEPFRKVKILEAIANAQSTLSSYYESSTIALEVSTKFNEKSSVLCEDEKELPPIDNKGEKERFDKWSHEGKTMTERYRAKMEAKYGLANEPWDLQTWVKCSACRRWFNNNSTLESHTCVQSDEPIERS